MYIENNKNTNPKETDVTLQATELLKKAKQKTRRAVIQHLALGAVLTCAVATPLFAAEYPDHAIKIIVPFTVGGATDIAGRVLAEEIGKVLNGSAFVENREGAAGVIGVQAAMRAKPDGYTLLIAGNSLMTSHKTLYKNLPYDPLKDFDPVARVSSGSHILVVKANSPYKELRDLLAAAKAKPGVITYGSGGSGTTVHMAAEMFQVQSGVKLVHVPYRGTSLAVTGLMAGDTDVMFDTTASSIPRIKAGQLRSLGITSRERDPQLPDTPTVAEQGLPKYEAIFWLGLYAPKGTPPAVLRRVQDATQQVLSNDTVKKKFAEIGMNTYFASGSELTKQIERETQEWAEVINKAGVKLE